MYKNILLAADFDEIGHYAAKKAKEVANLNNANLSLLHVVETLPPYAYGVFSAYVDVEEAMIQQARTEFDNLAKEINVATDNTFVKRGLIKDEVLNFAKEKEVDLIIVGSHGKRGLSLMLGSKANGILHAAPCDVLVVRAEDSDA